MGLPSEPRFTSCHREGKASSQSALARLRLGDKSRGSTVRESAFYKPLGVLRRLCEEISKGCEGESRSGRPRVGLGSGWLLTLNFPPETQELRDPTDNPFVDDGRQRRGALNIRIVCDSSGCCGGAPPPVPPFFIVCVTGNSRNELFDMHFPPTAFRKHP